MPKEVSARVALLRARRGIVRATRLLDRADALRAEAERLEAHAALLVEASGDILARLRERHAGARTRREP